MSKININGSILDQVIGTKLNKFLAPQQNQGGLLNFVKSPYAGDIGMGLLAQSGYSTNANFFRSVIGCSNESS